MKRDIFLLAVFLFGVNIVCARQPVTITPQFPRPGDFITISYVAEAHENGNIPIIRFTYSNFFELPQKMEMAQSGSNWTVHFKLPEYAVLATFIITDGGDTIKPAVDEHFRIVVYNNDRQRVKNGRLYMGYSLGTQMGKSPDLKEKQAQLFREELLHYPDNYEAKLRLLAYEISTVHTEAQKTQLYERANRIIADKFYEMPGDMGHTNSTTMGYLIMGEKSRLDSLREVIRKEYPQTEAGYELRIDALTALDDTAKMVEGLENLLREENPDNQRFLRGAHEALFKYYVTVKNTSKTLEHLAYLRHEFTPYTPAELKSRAEFLYDKAFLLDTALDLARRSLLLVDTFPISLIRYFPETGYLPSYVSPEQRKESIPRLTGQITSLMALIQLQTGKKEQAAKLINEALAVTGDNETLGRAGIYFSKTKNYAGAFEQYRKMAYADPLDTVAYRQMQENYKRWKGNTAGIDVYDKEIKAHWQDVMTRRLEKEIINIPMPDVLAHYVNLKGTPVPGSYIRNKIVIMDFWATWCVPCMKAMPYMQEVYEQYKDDPGVVFMIVNSGAQNELSDAQNWWGNKTYSFPVFYNNDRTIGEKLGFNLIPATYIIDQHGNTRFKTIGFEGPSMTRKIAAQIEMLKEK